MPLHGATLLPGDVPKCSKRMTFTNYIQRNTAFLTVLNVSALCFYFEHYSNILLWGFCDSYHACRTSSDSALCSTLLLEISHMSQVLSLKTWAAMAYSSIKGSCQRRKVHDGPFASLSFSRAHPTRYSLKPWCSGTAWGRQWTAK